ncbi:SGNH/GDSL hydrolase family protein [Micromonospora sp. NPDC047738]|uniref:SGNH/GDSL hydrolase family protein n=1 Tax=Micromonospora sp. NPDC047738 TaxID=3155741 RepID=UPI00340A4FBE
MLRSRLATLTMSLATALASVFALATPAQAASTVRYVALGDSYASGVGAGNESGSCRRSPNAYPSLWATANAPASYTFVACSGATTTSVRDTQLGYLSTSTTLVSITVGGNDVGFSDVMTTCVVYGESACIAAVNAAEDKARTELPPKLNNLYQAIRARAPSARVVVIAYPVFYRIDTYCPGLSDTSRTKINEGINLLDDITKNAAVQNSFAFADVRPIFRGNELCAYGEKWLHALNWADTSISYHPTAAGQSGGYYPTFARAV